LHSSCFLIDMVQNILSQKK